MRTTDFSFVPGFETALTSAADAHNARQHLAARAARGGLSQRSRAMIALAVAQQGAFDYCIWAQTCAARHAGLSGEEIMLACAGTALDRKDAAMTRLARAIVENGAFSEREVREMSQDPLLSRQEMLDVAAWVGVIVIENCILMSVAPEHACRAGARPD